MMARDPDDDDTERNASGPVQMRQHREVREWVNSLDARIGELERQVADLREEQARLQGGVVVLEGAYNRAANVAMSQAMADAEERRTASIAVRQTGQIRQLQRRRSRAVIVVAKGVTAILLAIAGLIAGGKCS